MNTYFNVKEMARNRRVTDLPISECTKPPSKVRNEPRRSRNKRPHRDHRNKKDMGRVLE